MSDLQMELKHLKRDVMYPANRKQVLAACNNMSDVPADDRTWFQNQLPEGTYKNAEDILKALLAKV